MSRHSRSTAGAHTIVNAESPEHQQTGDQARINFALKKQQRLKEKKRKAEQQAGEKTAMHADGNTAGSSTTATLVDAKVGNQSAEDESGKRKTRRKDGLPTAQSPSAAMAPPVHPLTPRIVGLAIEDKGENTAAKANMLTTDGNVARCIFKAQSGRDHTQKKKKKEGSVKPSEMLTVGNVLLGTAFDWDCLGPAFEE